MIILILETSLENGLILLAKEEQVIASKTLKGGRELSKKLALETKKLLGDMTPELIAVGKGPGSYTGIRVGAALAKGLKIGFGSKVIGFSSLKALGPAPVLVDARRGGFYALLNDQEELIDPKDPRLAHLGSIGTPHPERIQKRLPDAQLEKRLLVAESLAKLVWKQSQKEESQPLKLHYVSHP